MSKNLSKITSIYIYFNQIRHLVKTLGISVPFYLQHIYRNQTNAKCYEMPVKKIKNIITPITIAKDFCNFISNFIESMEQKLNEESTADRILKSESENVAKQYSIVIAYADGIGEKLAKHIAKSISISYKIRYRKDSKKLVFYYLARDNKHPKTKAKILMLIYPLQTPELIDKTRKTNLKQIH